MDKHPVFSELPPTSYLSLLRTYIDLGVDYWLDLPFREGRVRLTNVNTGEYVIYGNLGSDAFESDIGADELVFMNVPAGSLRIRTSILPSKFTLMNITDDLGYHGVVYKWALRTSMVQGEPRYDLVFFDLNRIPIIRTKQYAVLESTAM